MVPIDRINLRDIMFEYHCWAVVAPHADSQAEAELLQALRDRIAAVHDDAARESFHVTTLNEVHVTASGLRNHGQGEVLDVFDWLAARCSDCYGLIYVRGEHPDPDGKRHFEVRRIRHGKVEYLEDRYFQDLA